MMKILETPALDAAQPRRLEISELSSEAVFFGTPTMRLDPEYFQQQYLRDEHLLSSSPDRFSTFDSFGLTIDASAFYPSIEPFYGTGTLPFLRVADVDALIDFKGCTTIPEELCSLHPTLAKVGPGDILFTKGGSIARIGLVTQPAAVSRDLIFVNSSRLASHVQAFLYLYFQTGFFYRSLVRSSSQTAQAHLTITLVRHLPVLKASDRLQRASAKAVDEVFKAHARAQKYEQNAEHIVLEGLGLADWKIPEPLAYECSSSTVFYAGRLDAEHFQPKFEGLTAHLDGVGRCEKLRSHRSFIQRGKQPEYVSGQGLPVINSKHVRRNEVHLDAENRVALLDDNSVLIRPGDVLVNGTGVGTIGRAAAYLHKSDAIPDNHVTVVRPGPELDPVFLSVFLNTIAGQLQVLQRLRGSSGQIEIYPADLDEFSIWIAPEKVQRRVRRAIEDSFIERQNAWRMSAAAVEAIASAVLGDESGAIKALERLHER